MTRMAAIVLALAGCFSKPTAGVHRDAGDDAPVDARVCAQPQPSAAGLVTDLSPSNTRVTMLDGSVVGFANQNTHYPMPDRLIVGGSNLVATPEGCGYEDQVGVAAYPFFALGARPVVNGNHNLMAEVLGPAVTVLRSFWSLPLPAPCGATQATGNTSWTFLPDGKVIRNDTIVPSEQLALAAGTTGCNCSGATGVTSIRVTSYATFEAAALDAVTLAFPGMAVNEGQSVIASDVGVAGMCVRGMVGAGKVALWWDRLDNQDPLVPPTRYRHEMTPVNHDLVAAVYDIAVIDPPSPPPPPPATLPAGAFYGIRTHMVLASSALPCTDVIATARAFAAIQPLQIGPSGNQHMVSYSALGVFDDPTEYTEPILVSGTTPDGIALRLHFPGFMSIATDRPDSDVTWQRHTDGTFFVFFRQGLAPNASIRISPGC